MGDDTHWINAAVKPPEPGAYLVAIAGTIGLAWYSSSGEWIMPSIHNPEPMITHWAKTPEVPKGVYNGDHLSN